MQPWRGIILRKFVRHETHIRAGPTEIARRRWLSWLRLFLRRWRVLLAGIVLSVGLVMMAIEAALPGRSWPRVRGWGRRAIALNGVQVATVRLAGRVWDEWLVRHRLWSADAVGTAGGALVGYLVITSFYKHPFEILFNGLLSSAILYLGVGVGPDVASLAVLLTGLAELFYHWNVRTPYWLGFVFQRPESHCIHHPEGLHSYNYGDLPLWDMLFGTFKNPRAWTARSGFGEGKHRLPDMLRGVDINRPNPDVFGP